MINRSIYLSGGGTIDLPQLVTHIASFVKQGGDIYG